MIAFFVSIAASLVLGYLTVVSAFTLIMLLVTRLGRKVLIRGDRVSATYVVLLWGTWFAASLTGAYVCARLAPLPPYGPRVFPCLLAVLSGLILFHETKQVPQEHSVATTLGSGAMVVTGTVGALYLHYTLSPL